MRCLVLTTWDISPYRPLVAIDAPYRRFSTHPSILSSPSVPSRPNCIRPLATHTRFSTSSHSLAAHIQGQCGLASSYYSHSS